MDFRKAIAYFALVVSLVGLTLPAKAAVLVHVDTSVNVVSSRFLLSAFSMRTRFWPDGEPIRVFVLPDNHPYHVRFTKQQLGVFPYQMRGNWDRIAFSGAGTYPEVVKTMEEMLEKISTTPGAIGYYDLDTHFQAIGVPNVKMLRIKE